MMTTTFEKAWREVRKYCGLEDEDPYHDVEPPLPIPYAKKRKAPNPNFRRRPNFSENAVSIDRGDN